jgi:hypothetical protein
MSVVKSMGYRLGSICLGFIPDKDLWVHRADRMVSNLRLVFASSSYKREEIIDGYEKRKEFRFLKTLYTESIRIAQRNTVKTPSNIQIIG